MSSSNLEFNQRIIPTSEEIKILREKLNNLKDLNVFSNNYNNLNYSGCNVFVKTPRCNNLIASNSKYYSKDGLKYNNSHGKLNVLNAQNQINQISDKEMENMNQKYLEITKFLEANKEKIERIENYDQLLKENEDLKEEIMKNTALEGSMTFKEILHDYIRMKSDYLNLLTTNQEQEKHILNLEKQIKLILDVDSNTYNKNYLKLFIIGLFNNKNTLDKQESYKIISGLFPPGTNFNVVNFLNQRIESLELQNYSLITKLEKFTINMTNYLNEMIEYSEVISDIKNVINQVYETQSLTTEFLIIRDTLNNRGEYLQNQKNQILEEKEKLTDDSYKQINMDILLCKDKMVESKLKVGISLNSLGKGLPPSGLSFNNKLIEALDEKIEIYDNIKNDLAQFHDKNEKGTNGNNFIENLINDNYILKNKNIKLQEIVSRIIKNTKNLDPDNIDEETFNLLNEIINSRRDIMFTEDLFNMVKVQALEIESILN